MADDGGLNPAVMAQLADLINTQIDKKMESRDQQMMVMQQSMTQMMGQMQKLTTAVAANSPVRNSMSRRVSPPRRPERKTTPGQAKTKKMVQKSASTPTLPKIVDTPVNEKNSESPQRLNPDGTVWVSPANKRLQKVVDKYDNLWATLPRVAELKVDRSKAAVAGRAQELINERDERQRLSLKYDECRSTVFAPSDWSYNSAAALRLKKPPETELALEYAHGYHNTGPYTSCTNNNAFILKSGEVVYYTSAVGIVLNTNNNTQRFYMGHDDDIISMAIHPDRTVVATGQVGRSPNIHLWDTGAGPRFSEKVLKPGDAPETDDSKYPLSETTGLGQLKLHTHGITSLDFSPDGKLLCSIGQDPYHLVGIWDWNDGILLTTARGHNAPVYAMKFNTFQYFGIPDERDGVPVPRPGQAQTYDDSFYCLTSLGDKHIKFWTLRRDVDPATLDPGGLGGVGGKDDKKKRTMKEKKAFAGRSLPKIWRLEGGSAASSHMADPTQNFNCLTFVNDTQPIRTFKEGRLIMPDGREGDPALHWGGLRGRIIVGTAGGDIYVYWQPRAIPREFDGLSKDEYIEGDLVDQSLRPPWWELPEGTPYEKVAEYRWMPTARLVHVVARDLEYGNHHLIPKKATEKLIELRRQLKGKPRDKKLLDQVEELRYKGEVGHKGGVTSIAWQGDGLASRVISCGSDEYVREWDMQMEEPPATYGVLGQLQETNGKQTMIPCKSALLSEKMPMVNVSQPDEGTVSPLGKTVVTSLDWDDARVLMGSTSNTLLDFFSASMEFEVLVRAHTDAVNGLSVHRTLPIYGTVSADKTVRVWRSDPDAAVEELKLRGASKSKNCFRRCVATAKLPAQGCCVAWHPSKAECVIGLSNASFCVFRLKRGPNEEMDTDADGNLSKQMKEWIQYGEPCVREMELLVECDISVFGVQKGQTVGVRKQDNVKRKRKQAKTSFQEQYAEEQAQAKKGGQKIFKSKEEIQDIRYSPNGRWLACASRDNYIHIFDTLNNYRRQGTCKGHSSYVTHIDWSLDSKYLQSNDGAYEILYWFDFDGTEPRTDGKRDKCRQYTYAMDMRDTNWDTWTTVLGWPVQGIWSPYSDGTDVNSLFRSNSEKYTVCGDDSFQVNLFTWPVLKGGYKKCKQYKGHCSHVLGLQFTGTDSHVISVGGNDASIFEWRHRNASTQKKIRFLRPLGYNGSLKSSGATAPPTIEMAGLSTTSSSTFTTPAATKRGDGLNSTL